MYQRDEWNYGYHHRKRTWQTKFKSWSRLSVFYFMLISLGKSWTICSLPPGKRKWSRRKNYEFKNRECGTSKSLPKKPTCYWNCCTLTTMVWVWLHAFQESKEVYSPVSQKNLIIWMFLFYVNCSVIGMYTGSTREHYFYRNRFEASSLTQVIGFKISNAGCYGDKSRSSASGNWNRM